MAVDLSKLAFYSGSRYERIALKGNFPFTIAASTFPVYTITHNLGYIPYVKLWYTFSDSKYFPMFSGASSFSIDGNLIQVDDITVTTTTISVTMENDDSVTHTGTIYYRIYAEPQA
jgi:hypothetical protein